MSTATTASRLAPELRAICGAEHVVEQVAEHTPTWERPKADSPTAEAFFSVIDRPQPIAVTPGSVEEIAAILRLANEQGFGVLPAGSAEFRPPASAEIVLITTRLTDVEHYDPADLTVGVGAGTTVAQLNAMVGADHLLFALDPPFPERATIGGVLATASHGPLRHGYGGLRDFCLGIRFVSGDGRKAKGGGRVVKNVAGYDMMKLLIGSQGTLALITSASFKLFPAPRQTRTFVAQFTTWMEALKFRDLVLRSPLSPMCLELVSPNASQLMRLEAKSESWKICVRASGSDVVLARYRKELGSAVTRELEGEDEKEMWRKIENCGYDFRLDIMVPSSGVADVLESLEEVRRRLFEFAVLGRVGIGHVQVHTGCGESGGPNPAQAIIDHLRQQVKCEISFCMGGSTNPWPVTPSGLQSMRAVKTALDPKDILNRGRFPF